MTTMRLYPAVTIERDRIGNLKMWRGGPVAEGQKCADLYVQVDHGKEYILADLGAGERNNYELGYRITTHNIDPAYFGEYADRPEWFQKLIDESETPLEQEQTSGTDVLPSDCQGCPLYQAKEHKDAPVGPFGTDRRFLRYLLWKEVRYSGYTEQISRLLSKLYDDNESDRSSK